MRIGDAERSQASQALGEHFAKSRLTVTEYEERLDRALRAVTRNDLMALFADLPGPRPMGLPTPPPGQAPGPPLPYRPTPYPGSPGYGGLAWSDKSRIAAGVLQIVLPFGIGRFYTGHTGVAIAQLLLFFFGLLTFGSTSAIAVIWCLIDGIVLLANTDSTDAAGRRLSS